MSVLKDEQTGTWKVIYRYTDYFGEKKQTRLTDLAARMSFNLNSPRRLWTILAVFSEELPPLNAASSVLLNMHSLF